VIGAVVVFAAVKAGVLVVPLPTKPIAVLELVQVYVAPLGVLVNVLAGTEAPAQTATFDSAVTTGIGFITIVDVAVTAAHPPEAAIVFVTVYVPAVLAVRLTCPVEVLTKTKPAVEENVPATPPPLNVGDGFVPFLQYGVPV
jgi:hypothetical protein